MGARTILITGTSRGLGQALSEHFLAQGDTVIGCARSEGAIEHPQYQHHRVDITSEAEVTRLFSGLKRQHSHLDALINNAGIASMNAFALTPASTAARILNTNILGTFLFCQKALRLLKKSQNPRIVNFSTIAVPLKLEGESIYAASKSAIETLTQVLSKEYAPFGITCNAIGPSPIDTALIRNVPKAKIDALLQQQSVKQMATAADVIHVIEFFLSPNSRQITGQKLYLGGFCA
ncbi:3-oxoacyl-[acyl-carrier-protein] reductase FabG [Thiorhodovibrio winogradskyi]|uniref:3-oxoacyl-[acyl-carrier-protein] reductase FabG n=1 Tax=Thiorhodovibrio winogradskyi TaxID=77007 RepID=A0ABZ0SAT0_9GAMM|nr:SDR family oxidoreductase [Thiorhodovibrio winogradskyi]